MITRIVSLLSLLLLAFGAAPVRAQAPKDVVIGVLYPLSGPVAQVGVDSVMEIVNFAHGEFLMLAMFSSFWAWSLWRLDPLVST